MSETITVFEDLRKRAEDLAKELKDNFEEIRGASICGSLSYGSADEFSDIDLDIWLFEETYQKWKNDCPLMEHFKKYSIKKETPTNFSFCIGNLYKFDLALHSIEQTQKDEWQIEQKADRKRSLIIFDKEGIVRQTLDDKMKIENKGFDSKEKYSLIAPNTDHHIFYISAYLNYHVPIALARKSFEQAHLNLNWAINLLIELLWLKKEIFYPYMKSRWIIIEKFLDEEEKELLKKAQIIREYNEEDVQRRRQHLRELFSKLGFEEATFEHEKLDLR